jgi:hypothetical protein
MNRSGWPATRGRTVGAVALGACLTLLLAPASYATESPRAPEELPADVREWYDSEGDDIIHAEGADFRLDRLEAEGVEKQHIHQPHAYYLLTQEVMRGEATAFDEAFIFHDEWIAAVSINGSLAGTLGVYRDEAGEPSFAGLTTSAPAAEALHDVRAGETVVHDPPGHAWYAYTAADDSIRPLNHDAREMLTGNVSLADFAEVMEVEYASVFSEEAKDWPDDIVGGGPPRAVASEDGSQPGWAAAGGALALVLAFGAAGAFRARRRPV